MFVDKVDEVSAAGAGVHATEIPIWVVYRYCRRKRLSICLCIEKYGCILQESTQILIEPFAMSDTCRVEKTKNRNVPSWVGGWKGKEEVFRVEMPEKRN